MYYFIKQNTQYRCFNFKYVLSFVFVISIFLSINPIKASSVQIIEKDQILNAEFKEVENKEAPIFLILHGTFALHGMELISALQENLFENGLGSLAFTLSLSENNRKEFFNCSHQILSKHEDAQLELDLWLTWLEKKGYKNIHIIGHSRGGAQVAQFVSKNAERIKNTFLIAPLVWEEAKESTSFEKYNKKNISLFIKNLSNAPKNQLFSIKQALHCSNTKISKEAFLSYYTSEPEKNTVKIIQSIKSKVFVYLGDSDPLTVNFNRIINSTSSPKSIKIKTIEDADHFFRDFAAEDIVEDILVNIR